MVANGLVTSGVLVPQLQFTLRGFMARTATDEALPLKFLFIIAHILTLWALLCWLWLWALVILRLVPL